MTGKSIDDQSAEAVKGFAVTALYIKARGGAGIGEAVVLPSGKIETCQGDCPAQIHHFFKMKKFTEILLEIVPVVEHVGKSLYVLKVFQAGLI